MSVFAPSGASIAITLVSNVPQTVVLPVVPASNGAIRIARMSVADYTYIKLGSSGVTVSQSNGMPIKPAAQVEIVGVADAETHIAVLGPAATLTITAGSLIG